MSKTEVLRIRLTPAELGSWRDAAGQEGVAISRYVREAVAARLPLERNLREQEERERENARRQRCAALKLAELEERRSREPTRQEMLAQVAVALQRLEDAVG